MNLELTPGRMLAAALVVLSAWIVHGFIEALLAAAVAAIASWPLYARFRARLPRHIDTRASAAIFTSAITVFVLAPLVFACGALLHEAHGLLRDLSASEGQALALPRWLAELPTLGPWLAARWPHGPAVAASALTPAQGADPSALLGWIQSLGQFTFRHALIVAFSILLLGFLYQKGEALTQELTIALRQVIGDRADRYLAAGTRAIRASVNGMLVVGLFDGLAAALAFLSAGAPHPLLWAAITGALAAVPFLGYAAVAAMALQLALQGAPAATATLVLTLGGVVLLVGDKLVRPLMVRGGVRLPFVWVLMGCIGGFGILGLAGLVIGPAVLSLTGELWEEHARRGDGDEKLVGGRSRLHGERDSRVPSCSSVNRTETGS